MRYEKNEIRTFLIPMQKESGAFTYTYLWEISVAQDNTGAYWIRGEEGSRNDVFAWSKIDIRDIEDAINVAVELCKRQMGV